MTGLGAFLFTPFGRGIVAAVAVLLLLGGLYACGRQDGREDARTDSLDRTIEAVETRRDAEDAAARDPDPAERLRQGWGRD